MEDIIRTDYDLQQGDRYRQLPKGDSTPTDPKWIAYDEQLKGKKRKEKGKIPTVTPQVETPVEFSEEDEAFRRDCRERKRRRGP